MNSLSLLFLFAFIFISFGFESKNSYLRSGVTSHEIGNNSTSSGRNLQARSDTLYISLVGVNSNERTSYRSISVVELACGASSCVNTRTLNLGRTIALANSDSTVTQGRMSLSYDKRELVFVGFGAAQNSAGTSRVLARIDHTGNVTTHEFSGSALWNNVITFDRQSYIIAASDGLYYTSNLVSAIKYNTLSSTTGLAYTGPSSFVQVRFNEDSGNSLTKFHSSAIPVLNDNSNLGRGSSYMTEVHPLPSGSGYYVTSFRRGVAICTVSGNGFSCNSVLSGVDSDTVEVTVSHDGAVAYFSTASKIVRADVGANGGLSNFQTVFTSSLKIRGLSINPIAPPTPSPSQTPSTTPTRTTTATNSATTTSTASMTQTRTPSVTPTVTPSKSSGATPSNTPTPTSTLSVTQTGTPSTTGTQTVTPTASLTVGASPSITPSVTPTPSNTPTVSFSSTPPPDYAAIVRAAAAGNSNIGTIAGVIGAVVAVVVIGFFLYKAVEHRKNKQRLSRLKSGNYASNYMDSLGMNSSSSAGSGTVVYQVQTGPRLVQPKSQSLHVSNSLKGYSNSSSRNWT